MKRLIHRWKVGAIAASFAVASIAGAATVQMVEHFTTDPGWDAFGNTAAPLDFGYSPATQYAEGTGRARLAAASRPRRRPGTPRRSANWIPPTRRCRCRGS